jgi:hypothetical protein
MGDRSTLLRLDCTISLQSGTTKLVKLEPTLLSIIDVVTGEMRRSTKNVLLFPIIIIKNAFIWKNLYFYFYILLPRRRPGLRGRGGPRRAGPRADPRRAGGPGGEQKAQAQLSHFDNNNNNNNNIIIIIESRVLRPASRPASRHRRVVIVANVIIIMASPPPTNTIFIISLFPLAVGSSANNIFADCY